MGIQLIDRNDELCILYEKSNIQENILKLGTTDGTFIAGDIAIGSTGTPPPEYTIDYVKSAEYQDKYDQSDEIEAEADAILDFSESNPFGQV